MYETIKQELKRSWDLTLVVLLSLLLAPFIYLVPYEPVRMIIGLPFILFFPGYALIATLYPEKRSLELLEHVALSFGLSIAVVSLIGFGLNYTPLGIRLEPILWSLILFSAVFGAMGIWRRSVSAEPFLPPDLKDAISATKMRFLGMAKLDKALNIVVVLTVLSSVMALVYVVAMPKESEHFTEFYVLGPSGRSADYPHNLTVNQSAMVYLGITNHEYRVVNYSVEVWMVNETFIDNVTRVHELLYVDGFSLLLDHVPVNIEGNWTQEWQQPYNFSIPHQGVYKIWFVLMLDGVPFQGVKYQDYAGTATQDRFLSMVDTNRYYSLNLNLNISA